MRRIAFLGLSVIALASPGRGRAQEVEVPAELQFTLLAKALTFDRNLAERVGSELVIALVHQRGYNASRDYARAFDAAWRDSPIRTIAGIPVRYEAIELSDVGALGRLLSARGVDVVVLAPLRAVPVRRVLEETQQARAMTMTAAAQQVDEGAVLGIGLRGGKPRIRINLTAARSASCDFDANLLKLAEVVR